MIQSYSLGTQELQLSCVCACMLSLFSHVWLFMTIWTLVLQAPLSMGFSRQEYWSGFPWPSPGDLLDQGLNPYLLCLLHLAGGWFTTSLVPPGMQCGRPGFNPWVRKITEGMATHSSILTWRIPMDRGGWRVAVHRMQRVRHDWVTKHSTA